MTKLLVLLTTFTVLAVVTAIPASAQNCRPLYGGGVTEEQACDGKTLTVPAGTKDQKTTPAPKPKATSTPKPGNTTKGGLPVVSPAPQKNTPSTGPEVLGLIALIPAAGLGMYLRRKQ